MNNLDQKNTRESSKNALKMVYYIIIGMAIAESLSRTFLRDGSFIGWKILSNDNLPTTILLLAFLPTICRFVHGASLHLDVLPTKRYKTLFDFIAFGFQASLFYIMGITLNNSRAFMFAFSIMLASDAIWIAFLCGNKYTPWDSTEKQWLGSDVFIILMFVFVYLRDRTVTNITSAWAILIIAVAATIADYTMNRDFYFPRMSS